MLVIAMLRSVNTGKTRNMGRRLHIARKSCNFTAHIELLYRSGTNYNNTWENGKQISEANITSNLASAYYSKEGKEMNVPKWD